MENSKNTLVKNHDQERKWISVIALVISVVLLVMKFYAYHLTNSQSIYSDALESIVNVVAGIITLIVIVIAAKPADDDHPYGHGKVESMSASVEWGAITLAGLLIVLKACEAFYEGSAIKELDIGLIITIVAGLANGVMGYLIRGRGIKLHSEALQSSGIHLMTDALTSVGVLISLLLVKLTGFMQIDPILAIIFGFMLCLSGVKILVRSGHVLLDGHDRETLERIGIVFEKTHAPGVIHIHYTRVIRSGNFHHIDCHMVIPEFWTIAEAHNFSEVYDENFVKNYPVQAELHIHLDPCRRVYCDSCDLQDCPIRQRAFVKRVSLDNIDVMTAPEESR